MEKEIKMVVEEVKVKDGEEVMREDRKRKATAEKNVNGGKKYEGKGNRREKKQKKQSHERLRWMREKKRRRKRGE